MIAESRGEETYAQQSKHGDLGKFRIHSGLEH